MVCSEHSGLHERLKNIERLSADMHKAICGPHSLNTRVRVLEITLVLILALGFGFEAFGVF